MDLAQSLTGLALGLFMWGHMFFVSTILVSKDFMWTVARMFEGQFIFGKPYPGIVSVIVAGILMILMLHAFLAMRYRRILCPALIRMASTSRFVSRMA